MIFRGVAQFGRVLASGARGRAFESRHPDLYVAANLGLRFFYALATIFIPKSANPGFWYENNNQFQTKK